MDTLVIRLGLRHARISEFVKVKSDTFSVGRALKNDLVLSDPYIAPEQLRFSRDESGWSMEIMDFINPIVVNDEPVEKKDAIVKVHSGDCLVLGRTHMALFSEDHPSDATRTMVLSRWLHHSVLRRVIPLLMLAVACAITGLSEYSHLATEMKLGDVAMSSLIVALAALGWSSQWALAGRILHHHAHFFAQLFYTSSILAAICLLGLVEGYVEYMLNSNVIESTFIQIFLFGLITALLKFNLSYATHIHRKWTVSFAVTTFGAVVIFSLFHFNARDFKATPEYSAVLRPPVVKLLGNQSLDEFMMDFEAQFELVDSEIDDWKSK
ncbi:MAG: FHA domain-containing protein [Pseudomonadales bacterium]|nr:FHA domain-containing protein [Pseudomonadales bacterium]